MNIEETRRRANSQRLQRLRLTTHDQKQPYVFISYKSGDWQEVLEDIVYRLQKEYGLRVYYDRDFDRSNENWCTTMQQNMRNGYCMCVLAFFSRNYVSSYAALMELLHSQSNRAALSAWDGDVKEIIPIFLDEPYDLDSYVSWALNETGMQFEKVGITEREWKELKAISSDCRKEEGKTPAAIVTVCGDLERLEDRNEYTYEMVAEGFQTAKSVITGNNKPADGSGLFYENLAQTIRAVEKKVYVKRPELTVFDPELCSPEDLQIPMSEGWEEKPAPGQDCAPEPACEEPACEGSVCEEPTPQQEETQQEPAAQQPSSAPHRSRGGGMLGTALGIMGALAAVAFLSGDSDPQTGKTPEEEPAADPAREENGSEQT